MGSVINRSIVTEASHSRAHRRKTLGWAVPDPCEPPCSGVTTLGRSIATSTPWGVRCRHRPGGMGAGQDLGVMSIVRQQIRRKMAPAEEE